jgi:hypothetical protein
VVSTLRGADVPKDGREKLAFATVISSWCLHSSFPRSQPMSHHLRRGRSVRASGFGAVPSWFRSPERGKGKDLSSAFRRGYISCVFVCATCSAAAPIIPSSLRPVPSFAYHPLLGPGPPPFLVDSQCLPRLQACRAGLDVMGCRPSPRGTEEDPSGGTQSRRALLLPPSLADEADIPSFALPFRP